MRRSKNYVLVDDKLYKRNASQQKKERESYMKLMKAHAETTRPHARWLAKSSDQDSNGPQHYQTQNYSSNDAQDASTSPNRVTCLLTA